MPHPRRHRPPARLALAALVALAVGAPARAQSAADDPLVTAPAQARIGYERVKVPDDRSIGLLGTTYLIGLGRGFAVGPAAYGAISGRRGGLFTVGAELAWRHRIAGPLGLDLGVYAGGGGGGSAPVGGGLMLRPHADLLWDFGPFRAGLSWAQVKFPDGAIASRQVGLVWSADTDFRYLPGDRIGQRSDIGGRSGMGFDRVQAVWGVYDPLRGARRVNGTPLTARIAYVGARLEHALGNHAYWGVEASGAASGGSAGYAEYLATLGTESAVWSDVLVLGARAAVGMGGGGELDVGGGLLAKGGLYGTVRLTRDLGFTLEGGFTRAPQGSFRAVHAAASLNWILDDPSDLTAPPLNAHTEWVGGVERYTAQRRDGTRRDLDAAVLKVHRFIGRHLYLSGQVHSAYGGGAGGYTSGLLGLGLQGRIAPRIHVGADAHVGAAGGGGVDTAGGAVFKPNVYVGVDLGPSSALRVGAGRIRSLRGGGLDASTVDIGFVFHFGVAGRGYN